MKKNIYISFLLNVTIFLLFIFAIICELFDFHFMTDGSSLKKPDFSTFKYFTTDSNIFAGIISGIFAIYELLVICVLLKSLWLISNNSLLGFITTLIGAFFLLEAIDL